ncbi:hypothetical protein L9F63_023848, partial [Diploptera punctata]
ICFYDANALIFYTGEIYSSLTTAARVAHSGKKPSGLYTPARVSYPGRGEKYKTSSRHSNNSTNCRHNYPTQHSSSASTTTTLKYSTHPWNQSNCKVSTRSLSVAKVVITTVERFLVARRWKDLRKACKTDYPIWCCCDMNRHLSNTDTKTRPAANKTNSNIHELCSQGCKCHKKDSTSSRN